MTRDEYRAKCIEGDRMAWVLSLYYPEHSREWHKRAATAAFDSLHGIAFVGNIISTFRDENGVEWHRMSRAGDLTNPPEKNIG